MIRILTSPAAKVAVFYGLCAAAWIVVSDWLVRDLVGDVPPQAFGLQIAKGLFFVLVMSAALYLLVSRLHQSEERNRRMEEMLRVSKRLETIGTLAANMVHDLNNMLAIIRGFTDLARLEQGRIGVIPTKRLTDIEAAVVRANALVRQMSAFIQRQPSQRERLNPGTLVRELEPLLRQAATRAVSLDLQVAADLPEVPLDRSAVEQALLNLVINARDAMQGSRCRELRVEVGWALLHQHVSLHQPKPVSGRFVRIRVTDTGCGIPAANIIAIFSPFFTTKPAGQGTGLGLASVLRTAQQHEGWVEVTSQLGSGSSFDWYVPTGNGVVAMARSAA